MTALTFLHSSSGFDSSLAVQEGLPPAEKHGQHQHTLRLAQRGSDFAHRPPLCRRHVTCSTCCSKPRWKLPPGLNIAHTRSQCRAASCLAPAHRTGCWLPTCLLLHVQPALLYGVLQRHEGGDGCVLVVLLRAAFTTQTGVSTHTRFMEPTRPAAANTQRAATVSILPQVRAVHILKLASAPTRASWNQHSLQLHTTAMSVAGSGRFSRA